MFKATGATLGGLALGGVGAVSGPGAREARAADDPDDPTQRYSYLDGLDPLYPGTPLEDDEMRITFMGSGFPPPRRAQAEMSLFVEVGPWVVPDNNPGYGRAKDSFIFDCGSGVSTNYNALRIPFSRMDKVFLNHLHGDHMNDLGHIYWLGPSVDRKSPLYVWGPKRSGITCPAWGDNPPKDYDDGTRALCQNLREALRWATESFSFQTTSYQGYDTPTREGWVVPQPLEPVGDDPPTDGYALVPIELDWTKYGKVRGDNVAYYNPTTGVKISHFPVIHCRKSSMGYKLEWNGLSMIYTSDTKPECHCIEQASGGGGVDVFIHEMILPADVLTMKTMGITDPSQVPPQVWEMGLNAAITVQNSSHTPQGAYGYLLSQIKPPPRLAVATHFTVADDTVALAMESVRAHVPGIQCDPSGKILDGGKHPRPGTGNITWSGDLMVLRVFPDRILVQKATVKDYTYQPYPGAQWPNQNPPKYDDGDPTTLYGDAYAQIDTSTAVPATDPKTGKENYREDGY
jgi:ribonuclease Z